MNASLRHLVPFAALCACLVFVGCSLEGATPESDEPIDASSTVVWQPVAPGVLRATTTSEHGTRTLFKTTTPEARLWVKEHVWLPKLKRVQDEVARLEQVPEPLAHRLDALSKIVGRLSVQPSMAFKQSSQCTITFDPEVSPGGSGIPSRVTASANISGDALCGPYNAIASAYNTANTGQRSDTGSTSASASYTAFSDTFYKAPCGGNAFVESEGTGGTLSDSFDGTCRAGSF